MRPLPLQQRKPTASRVPSSSLGGLPGAAYAAFFASHLDESGGAALTSWHPDPNAAGEMKNEATVLESGTRIPAIAMPL